LALFDVKLSVTESRSIPAMLLYIGNRGRIQCYRVARIWNNLPADSTNFSSLNSFSKTSSSSSSIY